jgi:hypothetical protein
LKNNVLNIIILIKGIYMKRIFSFLISAIVVALLIGINFIGAYSQKISEQQEVAIFKSYYTYDIPPNVVNKLDDGIVNLFATMKRFKLQGYQFRLSESNLESFIDRLSKLKEEKITKDQKFVDPKWGTITISPEDLEKLLKSAYIIIPNIKSYGIQERTSASFGIYYEVTMGVSLKVFDPSSKEIIHVIDVKTTTSGESSPLLEMITGIRGRNLTKEETINKCVDDILELIKYELRKVEVFKLYTTINDISNGKYFIELGKNYDINPGLELDVIGEKKITIGGKERTIKEHKGLVRVVNVEEDFSEVIPIFGEPKIGDQLVDGLRYGVIFKLFFGIQNVEYGNPEDTTLLYYFRNKWDGMVNGNRFLLGLSFINDGTFAFLEPQTDLYLLFSSPLTLNLSIGANYSIYLRNLKIKPHLGLDLMGAFTYLGTIGWWWYWLDFYVTTFSLGFNGSLSIEYLFSKYVGLSIEGGYRYTFPVWDFIRAYDSFGNEYQSDLFNSSLIPLFAQRGIFANASLVIRY